MERYDTNSECPLSEVGIGARQPRCCVSPSWIAWGFLGSFRGRVHLARHCLDMREYFVPESDFGSFGAVLADCPDSRIGLFQTHHIKGRDSN